MKIKITPGQPAKKTATASNGKSSTTPASSGTKKPESYTEMMKNKKLY